MTDSQSTEPYTPNAEIHSSPNVVPKDSGDEGDSGSQPLIVTPPPHPKGFGVAEITPPKVSLPYVVEDTGSSSTSGTSPGFLQVSDCEVGDESYEEETETDDESYTFSSHDGDNDIDGHGCGLTSTQDTCEDLSYLWQCPYCGRRASQNCCLTCMIEDAVFPSDDSNAPVDLATPTNDNETDQGETDQGDREPSN
eukprot:s4_g74.t1